MRLGILEGEFHWHKHDDQDEFFLVLDGELLIDLEDRATVTLGQHEGYTVPRGVAHRTRAPQRTAVLMVEAAGAVPTGDGLNLPAPDGVTAHGGPARASRLYALRSKVAVALAGDALPGM